MLFTAPLGHWPVNLASPGHHPCLMEAEMSKSSWINAHGQFMLPLCFCLDYLYLFHVSLLYYWLLLFLDLHLKLCFLQWGILWKEKAPSFYSRKGRFKESQRDYFRSSDYVSRFRMNVMYKLIRQKVEIYKTWKMSKFSILSTFYIHFPNNF